MPSREDLKALQGESLNRKILITQTRIIEWYLHYKGQVYVLFSGGKDSTVLLHIVRQCFPDIEAVFVDTGLEYPEIREFVKTFDNVTTIRPKMQFKDVIGNLGYPIISKEVACTIKRAKKDYANKRETYATKKLDGTTPKLGYEKSRYDIPHYKYLLDAPFKISDSCCEVMKKKPASTFQKECGKFPILGVMACESLQRQSGWLKTGCNSFTTNKSQPMSFWTEQDVLKYLKLTQIPYCSVYGEIVPKSEFVGQLAFDETPTDLMTTGCKRTRCMFCMFGVHLEKEPNRFQKMKVTHPKQYDYCIREENGLGLGKVLDFIGVKY